MQLGRGLVGVLHEELIHIAAVRSLRARPYFGVAGEETERCVGEIQSRAEFWRAVELKFAVLVVGLAGERIRESDLVPIVLARSLEERSRLDRVVSEETSHRIRDVEDQPLRVRRVSATIHDANGAAVKLHSRNFAGQIFPVGEEEGIVDAILRAVVETGRRIDAQTRGVVTAGDQKFIGQLRIRSEHPVD